MPARYQKRRRATNMKKLLLGLLFLPVLGFCDSLTLSGSGTGSLVISAPTTTSTSSSVYPATATASFPFGFTASTAVISGAVSISSNVVIPGSTFYANSYELRSSSIIFTPSTIGIFGTKTNDSALGGYVGEYLSTATLSAVNFGTSAQYRDLGTLVLTPGDWDVSLFLEAVAAGSTCTDIDAGIGTTAGNSSAGLSDGDNYGSQNGPTAAYASTISIPAWRVSTAATTTYYFKYRAAYSVGTPVAVGRMSARRIR